MRKFIWTMLALLMLTVPAAAVSVQEQQAELFGAAELERGLPKDAKDLMEDYSPVEQADFGAAVEKIFLDAAGKSRGAVKSAARVMLRILVVVILCQTILAMGNDGAGRTVAVAGALAITACCASDMQALMGLGQRTIDEITNFSGLLLPVMAASAAASGAPTGAGAVYAIGMLFSNLLIRLCRGLIVPCVYAAVALAMVDAALEQKQLQKLRELLEWAVRNGLKAILYLFTGFLAVTGILSGSADAAALKAAKLAFSGMIPVVGGILSDTAETVLASAGLLKNAVGTFGMLAVLAIFVLPFFRIGISYLAFKGTAALCGILGSGQGDLLDAITDAMGTLLAMTSSCALMCMLSCCCFMRVVRL